MNSQNKQVRTDPSVSNTDTHTRRHHQGPLLVTKRQQASQTCCHYCRAVLPKDAINKHLGNCNAYCYGDGRKLYDSFGAHRNAPKPVQAIRPPVRVTPPRQQTTSTPKQTPQTRQPVPSPLEKIQREIKLSPNDQLKESSLGEFVQSAMSDSSLPQGDELIVETTDYFDITGAKDDSGYNDIFLAQPAFWNTGACRLISATLSVLCPNSFGNTDNAKSSVMIFGGTPMKVQGDPDLSATGEAHDTQIVNPFAKVLTATDKPTWRHVYTCKWDALLSNGWEQVISGLSSTTQGQYPFRVALGDPDTGNIFTMATKIQARAVYRWAVPIDPFRSLATGTRYVKSPTAALVAVEGMSMMAQRPIGINRSKYTP